MDEQGSCESESTTHMFWRSRVLTETHYDVMRCQGITRRSFLKFCSLTASVSVIIGVCGVIANRPVNNLPLSRSITPGTSAGSPENGRKVSDIELKCNGFGLFDSGRLWAFLIFVLTITGLSSSRSLA